MIVMVCGLSGSGKTYLAGNLRVSSLGFAHVKASDLLRSSGCAVEELTLEDFFINQKYLVGEVAAVLSKHRRIVLDGHLLVETLDGPQLVPDTTISTLPLRHIVFVDTEPSDVLKRRPRKSVTTVHEIADLAKLELIHARRLARKNGIPFSSIKDGDIAAFTQVLEKLVTTG